MEKTLGPEAIGIRGLALADAIALAGQTGFTALAFNIREAAEIAERDGVAAVRDLFARSGVQPGCWSLPVSWRGDEATWRADLDRLPAFAALARELGCPRALTVIMPGSNDLPFAENMSFHETRLRPAAERLAAADCWLGLEFVGPKTLRDRFRHEFLYSLDGVLSLATAIGTGNVGVLLDIWHLYTSGGEPTEVKVLRPEQIVTVHVNDAPRGIPRDEQIDSVRALPLETGVLDLADFMGALKELGYDGPVMPEPFSQRLNELAAIDPAAAAREAAASMDALWQLAGLT